MKKKEIISICKKNNYLYRGIYDEVQWIGTIQAAFPLFDLPIMTDNQLLNFLDIEESKQEKYAFYDLSKKLKEKIDSSVKDDKEIFYKNIMISLGDQKMQVYATDSNDFVFIDPALLKPFKDISTGFSLYVRYYNAQPIVIVQKGLLTIGIIAPMLFDGKYADTICEMSAFFISAKKTTEDEFNLGETL